MKLLKAMATIASFTMLSRIAGMARDMLTASLLGAGPVADAFFVALKLPNFFRRIAAEGAFSVSFIPLYSKTIELEGEEGGAGTASVERHGAESSEKRAAPPTYGNGRCSSMTATNAPASNSKTPTSSAFPCS